ncbi:MAG: hypothetical protein DRQ37_04090 [Gammaproteobacteria bacterium]|nr:MAG: hypothetical protein DRQ37_04090 [Gammaproteobacteria bacterium]
MEFSDQQLTFLLGEDFSNGFEFHYQWSAEDYLLRSKAEILCGLVVGKNVLHVGCVDHSVSLMQAKIRRGKWLHGLLADTAARCFGVDLNAEGIQYMRDELGYEDVAAIDILAEAHAEISATTWDYLLLADVLEHIDNPVDFLTRLRTRFANQESGLLITVPNAFARENWRFAKRGTEAINTDHRYWFTPFTISKVLVQAGYRPERIWMCRSGVIKKRSVLKNSWLAKRPLLRDSIVVRAGVVQVSAD